MVGEEARSRLAAVVESSDDAILTCDLDGTIVSWNPGAQRLWGRPEDEVKGHRLATFLPDDQRADIIAAIGSVARGGRVRNLSSGCVTRDGSRIHASMTVSPVTNDRGEIAGASVIARDVTERVEMERAVKEREETFRLLFESNPLPMWVYDTETLAFLAVNRAAVTKYGYAAHEFLRMRISDIRPHETVSALVHYVAARRETLQESGVWRHVTKDGRMLEVEITSHLIDFARRPGALVVAHDVTARQESERRRQTLEARLRQSQKMEAVGQLAGGVAHDFNNLLAVILNSASFLRDDLGEGDERREDVDEIVKAAKRGAGLVRQLLAFSRKEVVAPQVLNVNDVIGDTEQLLRRTIGEDVRLDIELAPDLSPINMDRGQLEQILLNLVVNARDAMPLGGAVTIATGNVHREPQDAAAGDLVSIDVRDTGVGMNEQVRSHIFEPFFTTKEKGQGTGLGLATVYGIVEQSGGEITVESQLGEGSTFRISLPAAGDTSSRLPRVEERSVSGGEGQRVLLVEDEDPVRRLVERMLSRAGYVVLAAGSAEEAMDVLVAGATVDLLLSDVVMPGISGKALSDWIRASGQSIPTLYMSGYTHDIVAKRGLLEEGVQLLQKPFTSDQLLHAVHFALERIAV